MTNLPYSIYSLFSALIMHVYQMRSSVPSVVNTCHERIKICMRALKDISKVWLVAKMITTLFESILGNKVLEERLQKAAGKKHQKFRQDQQTTTASSSRPSESAAKRKFDEMDIGLPNGGPTPPVSYERSRPQTPAPTPSKDLGQASSALPQASPRHHHQESAPHFTGHTRPTTPFNGHFSLPATPPDLFLVTRTSPQLSPTLWENFQPDQLFPDGTAAFPDLTAGTPPSVVDPHLQMAPPHGLPLGAMMMDQPQHIPGRAVAGGQGSPDVVIPAGLHHHTEAAIPNSQQRHPSSHGEQSHMFGLESQSGWPVQNIDPQSGGPQPEGASQDDSWSSSSHGAPPTAPTTLNVEDWYVSSLSLSLSLSFFFFFFFFF